MNLSRNDTFLSRFLSRSSHYGFRNQTWNPKPTCTRNLWIPISTEKFIFFFLFRFIDSVARAPIIIVVDCVNPNESRHSSLCCDRSRLFKRSNVSIFRQEKWFSEARHVLNGNALSSFDLPRIVHWHERGEKSFDLRLLQSVCVMSHGIWNEVGAIERKSKNEPWAWACHCHSLRIV